MVRESSGVPVGKHHWYSRPGDAGTELWGYAREGSEQETELLSAGFMRVSYTPLVDPKKDYYQ